ncbi:MAG TPA: hypothetical protein VKI62_08395 [Bacteroidota bacterium]|nr:hypothetical protein [Bacteroidota bacterium]
MLISNSISFKKTHFHNQCRMSTGMEEMLNKSTDDVSKFNNSASHEIENTYNYSLTGDIKFVEIFNNTKNCEIIFKNDVSITYYQTKLYNGEFLKDRNQIMAQKVKQKKVTITKEVAKSTSINGITEKTT